MFLKYYKNTLFSFRASLAGLDNTAELAFSKHFLCFKKAFLEVGQTSRMELFMKIVNGSNTVTVFVEISILNVWLDS